jgi:hypothetical protein
VLVLESDEKLNDIVRYFVRTGYTRFAGRHFFLGELREHLGKLDRTKPTAVYCSSGHGISGTLHFLWSLMRHCPYLVTGLRRAGFTGGWLG